MTVNVQKAGTDLSSILKAYVGGHTQAAATGIQSGGADLNTLFDAAQYGTAAASVGIQAAGVDIGPRFAAFGSLTNTYTTPGSGTETVPAGSTQVTITLVAGGASGAARVGTTGGGGSGSRIVFGPFAVTAAQTMNYVVGSGGAAVASGNGNNGIASSAVSVFPTIAFNASTGGGLKGTTVGLGTGGTASAGTGAAASGTLTNGNNGTFGSPGAGGAALSGFGAGGAGNSAGGSSVAGGGAVVIFHYA